LPEASLSENKELGALRARRSMIPIAQPRNQRARDALVSIVYYIARSVIARTFAAASVSACILLACEASSQSASDSSSPQQQHSPSPRESEDRSFYLGTPVPHPEDLSGLWEAPDGHGGAVGIHLLLHTTIPVEAATLSGAEQKWLGLQVGLYQRSAAELPLRHENGFSDSARGGNVRYEGGRLTLHSPGYDLDLHRTAGDKWSGRFHREDFDSVVTLARPMLGTTSKATWFLGTWKSTHGPQTTCLHIAESSPGNFLAWADTLLVSGATSFPTQSAKPPYSWEHYGDLVKVQPAEKSSVWIEIPAYSAICCSYRFHATSANKGRAMKADSPEGGEESIFKARWTRVPGDTCIAPPG
jgi:hypothetical protein